MYAVNLTNDYDIFSKSTEDIDNENDDFNINLKLLLLSIPGGVFLLYLKSLMIWTKLKALFY